LKKFRDNNALAIEDMHSKKPTLLTFTVPNVGDKKPESLNVKQKEAIDRIKLFDCCEPSDNTLINNAK
jgi:hypothetical protein